MGMVGDLPNSDDLQWQIERRFKISDLMRRMFVLYRDNKELPKSHKAHLSAQEKDEWYPINRMMGAAFSLWRSAFLTQASSSRQKVYDHTLEFIGKVLAQNAISFADDHRMCELTIVYYNANARYRIERLYQRAPKLLELPAVQAVAEISNLGTVEDIDEKEHWDMLFAALVACFDDYEKTYKR